MQPLALEEDRNLLGRLAHDFIALDQRHPSGLAQTRPAIAEFRGKIDALLLVIGKKRQALMIPCLRRRPDAVASWRKAREQFRPPAPRAAQLGQPARGVVSFRLRTSHGRGV